MPDTSVGPVSFFSRLASAMIVQELFARGTRPGWTGWGNQAEE